MTDNLANWNARLEAAFEGVSHADRSKAGGLLRVIPDRQGWEEFLAQVRVEWRSWSPQLSVYPYCLASLYGGLAFYEYAEGKFWPQFCKAVSAEEAIQVFTLSSTGRANVERALSANRQSEINHEFARVGRDLGLRILERDASTDYVGSAVYLIGVPLSLWDGFLDVCEWALWQDDWKAMTDAEWNEAVTRRSVAVRDSKRFFKTIVKQRPHSSKRCMTHGGYLPTTIGLPLMTFNKHACCGGNTSTKFPKPQNSFAPIRRTPSRSFKIDHGSFGLTNKGVSAYICPV